MHPGAELEVIVETIVRQLVAGHSDVTVQRNVQLDGPDGARQIDVLVKAVVGPFDLTIVVECKDYRRKVDVTKVDALHSVLQDVGANMGVLVSRNGFSNAARNKAKRTGIKLLEADRLSSLSLAIPIHVRELRVSSVRIALDVKQLGLTDAGPDIITETTGFDLAKGFRLFLLNQIDADLPVSVVELKQHNTRPFSFTDGSGSTWEFDTRYLRCDVVEHNYFGLLGDISEALSLFDRSRNHATVLVSIDLFDFRAHFAPFTSRADLPLTPLLTLDLLAVPVDLFEGRWERHPEELMPDGPLFSADEVVSQAEIVYGSP